MQIDGAEVVGWASKATSEELTAPEERHLDDAFFRGYQKLEPDAKEQLRKILSTFKKTS